jgi:hypothetical protein
MARIVFGPRSESAADNLPRSKVVALAILMASIGLGVAGLWTSTGQGPPSPARCWDSYCSRLASPSSGNAPWSCDSAASSDCEGRVCSGNTH